jgi:cell wall-associated NlpC family hydrolase
MLYDQYGEWDLALAAYHWGPANVTANGRDRWPAATSTFVTSVLGVYTEFKARFPDIAASGVLVGNGPVGPEGCPTTAPPNTLRKGAETIGIYEICRQSVLQAPTPEAAKAIIAALSPALLGKFYSQPQRMNPEFSDCSSFVSRAYYAAGVNTLLGGGKYAPTTHTYNAGYPWTRFIPAGEARPGDLVLEPAPGHVSMQLALGFKVHTNKTGDVSHVTKNYDPASVDKFIRIDPAAAGPAR